MAAHDGREVKALGDGFMIAFASVRKALACAGAIQEGLEERNADSPGDELRVRIGVNTGEVVVEGDDLYGQAVNAAARIASRAKGGEILVSEIVRQLAGSGPGVHLRSTGAATGSRASPTAGTSSGSSTTPPARPSAGAAFAERTPFVGRESERAELRRLVDAGEGRDRGAGHDRRRTRRRQDPPGRGAGRPLRPGGLRRPSSVTATRWPGPPPYIPIVEAFEQALAQAPSPKAFREFLGDEAPEIARLRPEAPPALPGHPAALELPAEQERRYLFNSVWEVLARTAAAQPTLLVLDDIHWADEPTMLLIQHLAERIAEVPVLMVGLYRDSELDVGRPLSRTFEELTRRRLARRMRARAPAPGGRGRRCWRASPARSRRPASSRCIYAETEGNPFFTEEVFKHLAEEGRLFDADGRFRADLTVDDLDVPEGVRMVVGARLRRLGDDGPRVLGQRRRPRPGVLLRAAPAGRGDARGPPPRHRGGGRAGPAHRRRRRRRRRGPLHLRPRADPPDRARPSCPPPGDGGSTPGRPTPWSGPPASALGAAGGGHRQPPDRGRPGRRSEADVPCSGHGRDATASRRPPSKRRCVTSSGPPNGSMPPRPVERAELLVPSRQRPSAAPATGTRPSPRGTRRSTPTRRSATTRRSGGSASEAAYSLAWAARSAESVEMAERALDVLGDRVTADRARLLASAGCDPGRPGSPSRSATSCSARRWPSPTSWATRRCGGHCLMRRSLQPVRLDAPGRVRRGGPGIGRAASGRR